MEMQVLTFSLVGVAAAAGGGLAQWLWGSPAATTTLAALTAATVAALTVRRHEATPPMGSEPRSQARLPPVGPPRRRPTRPC